MKKMRQFFIMGVIAILVVMSSVAQVSGGVGSIDKECIRYGFSYGIAKYQCGLTDPDEGNGSTLTVLWTNCISVDWTADPEVAGVLSKEGTSTYKHLGGASGTVVNSSKHAISHITFCGKIPTVPEFGTPAIALAILLTTPAFAYLMVKKRE